MGINVITYGTFDMFHIGHLNLLRRAKSLGDKLIVGVSTDEFNAGKNKQTVIPWEQRAGIVSAIDCVDEVIPESSWDQKSENIIQYEVGCLVMGSDWTGKFDDLMGLCDVIYLERTEGISSTKIKNSLSMFRDVNFERVRDALTLLNQIYVDLK